MITGMLIAIAGLVGWMIIAVIVVAVVIIGMFTLLRAIASSVRLARERRHADPESSV